MIKFNSFSIRGLFGRNDVTIPIRDNKVVIVGYNGMGKSTILNCFYYLISAQWTKLDEIIYDEIRLNTNKGTLRVTKEEISHYCRRRTSPSRRFSSRIIDEVLHAWSPEELRAFAAHPLRSRSELGQFPAVVQNMPIHVARDLQFRVQDFLEESDYPPESELDNLAAVQKFFATELEGRILYLPTYRRIEKDIKAIFPEIENEIQEAIRRRSKAGGAADVYVELVNFGMEDVKSKINQKLEQLRFQALAEVSALTTRYLRDVIRNEANTYSDDLARKIDQQSLDGVFRRVDESILNADDRNNINLVVRKIKQRVGLESNERYVAHYVGYLIDIAERITKYEKPVRDFVEICNSYLFGKRFVFDNIEYKFQIRYVGSPDKPNTGPGGNSDILMEDLSSGEKQIVSLFSHLTLDDNTQNYIIIDEPELSLSVDWQQRFLADIANTRGCAFIGAVTHSPFVFDNILDKHAVDMSQHLKVRQ